ncbi:ABC transporter substrate-binding protein [Rhodovulum euryhalinum]|uniref:Amino acid/amide ABC transporter substrate-binding protein (HAAT family) n=1 Tax=Rhodovulum euryhalinum TaxID=35805 RepID=A0A4R2K772_9RHOB|nr:ABC transporter substrate-binding protein [Rhodovulum euryhalinum]TCO69171.1 amino acid/amide ABC transporter substrate-binding protein (HAAT family) [Rhodovulum euryhalinum]
MHIFSTLAFAAVFGLAPLAGQAADGVEPGSVRFAQIAPLEGPGAALGLGLRQGLLAAFDEANRAGGIHGRRIELDSLCDRRDPERSADRMRLVADGAAHVAVIGAVGAAQSRTIQPLADEVGMPFIGAATGDEALRAPWVTNAVNIRPTQTTEIEAVLSHLIDGLGARRIAVLHENDDAGRGLLKAIETGLARRDLPPVTVGRYASGTSAIKVAMLGIRKTRPDAVLLLGSADATAKAVDFATSLDFAPVFAGLANADAEALATALGDEAEGLVFARAVPLPRDDTLPIVAEYRAALAMLDAAAAPGFASLEGYIAGRLALAALDEAGPWLTRERYLATLAALGEVDLGGLVLHFGPGDNQGLDTAYLARIGQDGIFEPVPMATGGDQS